MKGSLSAVVLVAAEIVAMSLASLLLSLIRRSRLTADPRGAAIVLATRSHLALPVETTTVVAEVLVVVVVEEPQRRSGSRILMDSKLKKRIRSPHQLLVDPGLPLLLSLPLMMPRVPRTLLMLSENSSKR
jgi:hypothetical protein